MKDTNHEGLRPKFLHHFQENLCKSAPKLTDRLLR